ncbi:MAG: PEP-CTERM sorting domain-containing protein [Thermoguttaceae bacterium]|jgi:hypothetical protein
MRRLIVALVAVLLVPVSNVWASMTYKLVSYPSLQNGYDISGQITTDGFSNILSWDFTIYQGTTVVGSGTSADSYLTQVSGLIETQDELILPTPSVPNSTDFVNLAGRPGNGTQAFQIYWQRYSSDYYGAPGDDYCAGGGCSYGPGWYTHVSEPCVMGDPWILADGGEGTPDFPPSPIIPEPSTLSLLGMCALSLMAYAWRRRK